MVNDRSSSAQVKKNNRAEEWLKNAVKDKHVRLIPFSEISKVKYNVAKGGSGTIHLGAWRNMHVAIKEQHNTSDLIKELKMHKQVHDSNYIVKFFGITKHPLTQDTCIVMQFAENGCLQDYLEMQNVSIAWHTKYRLAWEIASGLDFIHRENIFHTDLHSRNILIDTDGKALITDFGLSKSVNKTIYTTKAGLFGVVPYVAPERMQNPTITYTAKCDIYSLGVILWELSSCMIPFESQLQDVMLAVNIIAGVREKTVAGTAVEYEMLYRRCWDGLPQNRPQMEIVLSELVELLAAEQLNPRTAESRPRSPRQRPLSSDSMVAPSTYDNDVALQSSPENSTHVRPASLLRPSVRQSFAQGMAPLMQGIPAVPIRQDRSGVRVSFLGEPIAKDSYTNGFQRANGVSDTGKPGGAKPTQRNTIIAQDGDEIGGSDSYNYGAGNTSVKTAQEGGQRAGLDSPVIHDTIPRGTIEPNASKSTDASASPAKEASPERPKETKDKATARAIGSDTSTPGRTSSSENPTDSPPSNQFLPPIPTFNTLSLASHFPSDIESTPTSNSPPLEPGVNKLPETAALALASGLSMTRVVSKLKLGSVKNIPTISPPPSGAPPPPPMAAAGHSNSPRVISPSSSHRAKIVSPPLRNGQVRASKTISPPPGPPPGPPLSRAFVPKPPPGPPPSTTPQQLGDALTGKGHDNTSSKTLKVSTLPEGVSQNAAQPPNQNASETTRPTPARQIPMGFPVVTPLSPPLWNKRPGPLAPGKTDPSMAAASSASTFASNSGSSAATSTAATTATGPSSGSSHRDFRPVSFLTQQPHSTLTDYSSKVELQEPTKGGNRKPAENPYIPSPHNNILPPSQLNILRSQSPDLNKRDTPNGRVMGSPSLKPSMPKDEAGASKVSQSPRMVPSNPGRPASPSSLRLAHGGGFPLFEASQWFREPKNPNRQRRSDEDDRSETRSISEPSYLRPQLHPSKESSSSTATTTTTATSISTLQSPPASGGSATTVETPTTTTNATGLTAIKPRVPFDNFYSLADPYKELNQNEPTDFFTAVTQSDNTTIERMLKAFPALIHDSHGFWPHPTPIHVAARSRHPLETMKILIKHGAALDRGDHNGTTVLHFVCEQYPDPLEAVVFLTKAGTDCNARDAKKRTPLMVLLQNTHIVSTRVMVDSMRVMFKFGASAKVADHQFQRSPLHYAILHCKEPAPVIELLLKKGADVNARDHRKSTPLHLILERMDNEELVQMLLLYGADPGIKNGNKRNALGVAAENLRVMSAWFLLENDLLSSAPESIKKASELCSKADGPDKNSKPLFKNMLSDWQGKEGKQRRIQLAQDCVLRVQRTPDMKTVDQTQVALELLETAGVPIGQAFAHR